MGTNMSKSTVANTLVGIGVAIVLLVAGLAIFATNSYEECVSRLLSGASPSDVSPPPMYRRLSVAFWGHRDLYLARVLAQECAAGAPEGIRRIDREALALGAVKTLISSSQRQTLSAVYWRAPDGDRGLTRAALAEWGRPPADLSELEMVWLFVVGQAPNCSRQRIIAEPDREFCLSLYQSRLAELDPSAGNKPPASPYKDTSRGGAGDADPSSEPSFAGVAVGAGASADRTRNGDF